MAFERANFFQYSAGEISPDTQSGMVSYFYESTTDDISAMAATGYFNKASKIVRYGSLIQVAYRDPTGVGTPAAALFAVTSLNPNDNLVTIADLGEDNLPSPYYETLAEKPLDFMTSGGASDVQPVAGSVVGAYANFSLNTQINDIAPPAAHSGIEHIECQLNNVEIFWSRPVIAGQQAKIWVQIRSATPTP
jgi:hypothetical protein